MTPRIPPRLIIDNDARHPVVINVLRAITAPTVAEALPACMVSLLSRLDDTPAGTPTFPTVPPMRVVA